MQTQPKPIHYNVAITSIQSHSIEVELSIASPQPEGQVLSLPAWIPGSYMIRDFAKHIVQLQATDASQQPLAVRKLDKQRWKIQPTEGPITITYTVYANDLSVRGAYINDQYAFFNGTNLFLCVEGQAEQPISLHIAKPQLVNTQNWQVATTMPSSAPLSHAFGEYYAANYAECVDHPVLIGEFDILPFSTGGVEFELILAGGHCADTHRIVSDLTTVCQHQLDFFADTPPISHYQFITLLTDNAFGGLEHISSTALMFSRNDLPSSYQSQTMTEGYQTFLSLCSHEFFHTWHVKRIKPDALFSAPLSEEQYTEQLWIYEGFTSYYDDLSLYRCGVVSQQDYLNVMAKNLTRLVRNQGRFVQSITESSFDAWTKFYKQDESAINNIVSYYNKGAVLAMCLDLLIKQQTQGTKSLDDVMRQLWLQHGKPGHPTDNQAIQRILKQHLAVDADNFLDKTLYSLDELPFVALLAETGVKVAFSARAHLDDKGGAPSKDRLQVDFGAQCKELSTGVQIQNVSRNSALHQAGVLANDQLIAIDGWQISKRNLSHRLNSLSLGKSVSLTLLRDKRLLQLSFTVQPAVADSIALEVLDQDKCDSWLNA